MRPGTFRIKCRSRLWVGFFGFLAAMAWGESGQSASLARYFPRHDLVAYAEFDGLDSHAELWRKTAVYRIWNETPTGALLETIFTQLVDRAWSKTDPALLGTAEVRILIEHVIRHGFALGVVKTPANPRPSCVGLVVRGGAKGSVRGVIEKLIASTRAAEAAVKPLSKPKGRTLQVEGGEAARAAWWFEGEDFAASLLSADGAEVMLETLDGAQPNAVDHPDRKALAQSVDGFTPIGLAFLDLGRFAPLPPQAVALGFDRVTRLEFRWGVQEDAVMTVIRLVAPAPRSGLLALFDQPTFGPESLAALPSGLAAATALSVDLGGLYDRLIAGYTATNPRARASIESAEITFRNMTGLRIRDDLLTQFGSKLVYYAMPNPGDGPTGLITGLAQGLLRAPRFVVVLEVKEAAGFVKVIDGAVSKLEGYYRAQAEANSTPPPIRIHPLKGVDHSYVVSISPSVAPLPAGFRPTFVLAGRRLILADNPNDARAALELQTKTVGLPATDALARPVSQIPRETIFASVVDDRRTLLPELIANVPALLQWGPSLIAGRWGRATNVAMARVRVMPDAEVPPMPAAMPPGMAVPAPAVRFQGVVAGPSPSLWQALMHRFEIDPDQVPTPESLHPYLFPSVYTLTADRAAVEFRTREGFPLFSPVTLTPLTLARLIPASRAARIAALRSESINNLKQIGLALHNFHSAMNTFPPQASHDKNKTPLLSWRVMLLPYLQEANLYNEFKLDEPWDSPHNKALIPRMPRVFAIPSAKAEPGHTFYRGFSSQNSLFDPKLNNGVGIGIRDITDGTSNTIAIVEAKDAVPWTKPDAEIPFDLKADPAVTRKLLGSLGGHFPGGFNVLLLDGSVRFINASINPAVLNALITRAGGEVISRDAF